MRNKATIIALLIVFSLICTWNLFHTYRSFSIESEINEATPESAASMRRDKDLMAKWKYSQKNAFSLGLDLQGGLFVTMEVGVEDILTEYAGTNVDDSFEEALKAALAEKVTSSDNLVTIFARQLEATFKKKDIRIPQNQNNGDQLLMARYFASQSRGVGATMKDEDVIEQLIKDTESAIQNTYSIIRNRIDQFGVASPNIQLEKGTGRILIELAGAKDPDRIVNLLQSTATLEFRETWTYAEARPFILQINDKVKKLKGLEDAKEGIKKVELPDSMKVSGVDTSKVDKSPEDGMAVSDTAKTDTTGKTSTFDQLLAGSNDTSAIDSNLLDDYEGLSGDDLQRAVKEKDPFLGLFDVNFQYDGGSPLVGLVSLEDTAEVNMWLRHEEIRKSLPSTLKFLWEARPETKRGMNSEDYSNSLGLIAIRTNIEDKAPLEGNVITDARQDYQDQSMNADVEMDMNQDGAKKWANLTEGNIGKSIAIVLDDYVQSYPTVQGRIAGGHSQITGNFTVEEAKDLANLLKAGALPVKAKILGNTTIGPTLGAENLNKGLTSFMIAFMVTIVFMIFYYSGSGIVANVALIVNLFYILGVSAAMGVVFTLPGLAAVVLTMGMAVDANVLIFERIREEQSHGKSFKAAISAGFKNAFSSVMDANITTFLTGLILFSFGVGPIRGFAVSLMIGIITSLIAALFITRLVLEYFANKGNDNIKFGTAFTTGIFGKINLKMTSRKRMMYVFSGILVTGSVLSIFMFNFKTGVDFKGGRQYVVEFNQGVKPVDVRDKLTVAFGGESPVIKSVETDNQLLITTSYLNDVDTVDQKVKSLLLGTLNEVLPNSNPEIKSQMRVGPTVADDIRESAIYSVVFSLIVIFLYILIRFRKYQYSLGAIAALFHDVTITLGIFSLFGYLDILPFSLEIDQAFIAAILTIIGYSINDTVVVFDRIRENFGEMKSAALGEIYDTSINQTFSRTLITSLTTMLTVLILFFFGGDAIKGFMFALFIGILVGTYSSIFVASPISQDLISANKAKV